MKQLPPGFMDGRKVPSGATFSADVCIVGSGPVGLSMAEDLAARGLAVCLVESGGLEYDPAEHELCRAELGGDRNVDPHEIRTRQFGGLSNAWSIVYDRPTIGVRYVPFDAIDFESRPEIPHSGWPMGMDELTPWYERAQAVCELGPFAYDGASQASPDLPCVSDPGGALQTTMFQFGPASRFYRKSRDILAGSGRVRVLLHTSAMELLTSEDDDHVKALKVGCLNGARFRVVARSYVLATGAIENARLMLLSDGSNPAGVGNRHDVLGRYLMDHPQDHTSYIVPPTRGVYDRLGLYDLRASGGVGYMAKLGFSPQAIRQHDVLNMTFLLFPLDTTSVNPAVNAFRALATGRSRFAAPPTLGGKLAAMARDPGAIARHLYRHYTQPGALSTLGHGGWSLVPDKSNTFIDRIEVVNQVEQYPHADNRVALGDSTDALGQRRLRYEFSWRQDDQDRFVRSRQLFAQLTQDAGLGSYHFDPSAPPSTPSSHHPMGTTRMHADPARGVVDANCKVHGLDNLFVAGASVFPTGGYANPTLSAVALGLRLAAFLAVLAPMLELG